MHFKNIHKYLNLIVLMSCFCCNQYSIDDVIKSKKEHSKRNNLYVEIVTKGFLKANNDDSLINAKCFDGMVEEHAKINNLNVEFVSKILLKSKQ
jgi:hypothetical protein